MNMLNTFATLQQGQKLSVDAANFAFFSLRTDSKLLGRDEQIKAVALSILMGILTIGLGHLVCKIICEIGKSDFNSFCHDLATVGERTLGGDGEIYKAMRKSDMLAMVRFFAIVGELPEIQRNVILEQLGPYMPQGDEAAWRLGVGALQATDTMIEKLIKEEMDRQGVKRIFG